MNKMKRVRVYRETMDAVLAQKGITKAQFNDLIGCSGSYYTTTFQRGYADLTEARARMWANAIDVSIDLITAIPHSKKNTQHTEPTIELVDADRLEGLILDGFRMIHQDIQLLIEAMDRYWKPEEPRYQIKEREQE